MADDYPCHLVYVKREDLKIKLRNLQKEKAELVQQIVLIKGESQQLFLQTKRNQDEIQKLKKSNETKSTQVISLQSEIKKSTAMHLREIQQLKKQNNVFAAEIKQLKSSIVNNKQLVSSGKSNTKRLTKQYNDTAQIKQPASSTVNKTKYDESTDSDSESENKTSQRDNTKQLEKQNNVHTKISQSKSKKIIKTDDAHESDTEYEVESISRHKTVKGIRSYLVHWMGFSSNDDCWVEEKNLFCPDVLAAYKIRKRLR